MTNALSPSSPSLLQRAWAYFAPSGPGGYWLMFVCAAAVLGGAYGFQYSGYAPCKLCWYQRYPYMVAIPLALVLALKPSLLSRRVGFTLLGLCFIATSFIGFFHAGVEYGYWDGPSTCSGALDLSGSIDDALAAIENAKMIRCDEVSWSLFSISMAGYNAIIAAGLAFYCTSAARKA